MSDLDAQELGQQAAARLRADLRAVRERIRRERSTLKDLTAITEDVVPGITARRTELEQQLAALEQQQQDLEEELTGLRGLQQQEQREQQQSALERVRREWIEPDPTAAYIDDDDEFVYIRDYSTVPERQNVQFRRMAARPFISMLSRTLKIPTWHINAEGLRNLFNQTGRGYEMKRYSIDTKMWRSSDVYLPISHMEPYFIDRMELTDEQQAWAESRLHYFDWLMWSLSGGRPENQAHIEQWILHKILNYRRAVTTPDLVIVGHVGGNGKGILQGIIRLMLPAELSGKANSKTLNGNFNAIMLGKLIVFFDDQNSQEIPLEVVKQLAGADSMIFEPKGKDQYEGEKTHSSAWFSNRLPFPLTPAGQEGGVDRRFSIMRTNITFLESIRHHQRLLTGDEPTVEESKDMAEIIVSEILLNRVAIAAWFQELRQRHPQVDHYFVLKALHGEDYHWFLNSQQDGYEQIMHNLIEPALAAGECVPVFVIREVLRHLEGRVPGDRAVTKRIMELCSQNREDAVISRVRVLIRGARTDQRRQCSVLHRRGAATADLEFAWSRVSTGEYTGRPVAGAELITEEDFAFGMRIDHNE